MLLWPQPQHDFVDFQKIRIHIIFGSLAAKMPVAYTRATFSPASSHLNRPWHALFYLSYSLLSLLVWAPLEREFWYAFKLQRVRQQLPIDCRMTHNRALHVRVMAVSSSKLSCFSLVSIPPFKYQYNRLPSDGLVRYREANRIYIYITISRWFSVHLSA